MTDASAKISPDDIETKFRDIQGQVEGVADDSKKKVAIGGAVGAVLILLLIYILGQKAGKKKSTVLEIRRL